MYNQLTPEIIEEIKKVSNNVFLGEEINPDYAKDEMPIYGTHMPDLAVQPRSTEEVAAVMKICYENNIPVRSWYWSCRWSSSIIWRRFN